MVPQGVPALGGELLVAHAIAAVRDPPRVGHVGNAVSPLLIVVRSRVLPEDRPHVLDVGDQLVLQGLDQVVLDQPAQVPLMGKKTSGFT